jgi:signal transduction histidine kinase
VVDRGDVLVALVLTVVVLADLVGTAAREDRPILLLLVPAAFVPVFLRRAHPSAALAIAVAAAAAAPGQRSLALPVLAVLYAVATQAPWRLAIAAGAGATVVQIAAGAAWGNVRAAEHDGLLGYSIGVAASCAAAVGFGLYMGAQRRVRDGLRERAERLDRERELLADRAVGQERVRIARELHDIVAHNVSLMVVEAQALGATVPDDRVLKGTDAIADLGRQAMTEMHTTLRLLRGAGDAPDLSPQPGLAQLERLIEQLRRAGLEIELTIEGQPRPLPQGVDLSAYRIIQEALTNVVKHAAGARTKVTLVYQTRGVELTIIDTEGEERTTLLREFSDGHGVIGMRERAALFGGRLTAESLPGGFKVTVTLPYAPTSS